MATEASQEISPKPSAPLTSCETLNYYFSMENALYEEKVRDTNSEMARLLQRVVDALQYEMMQRAEAKGIGAAFRSFMRNEQDVEQRTLRIRTTANKLKATRVPSRFLVSQLLSSVVFLFATDIFDIDWLVVLFFLPAMIWLGLWLPSFMDMLATHRERKLRELRSVVDESQPEWWIIDSTILRITF
jgi:hypothetical protein